MRKKANILGIVLVLTMFVVGVFYTPQDVLAKGLSSIEKSSIESLVRGTLDCSSSMIFEDVNYGEKKTLDFSKASARRKLLSLNAEAYNYPQKTSLSLFGKKTPNAKGLGGDWGTGHPVYRHYKYIKGKKNTYKVKVENWFFSESLDDTESDEIEKIGITTITLKKKQSSMYGYILKSMMVKRTFKS